MSKPIDYTLEWKKATGGNITLRAKSDGELIYSDVINIQLAKKRDEFAVKLVELGCEKKTVNAELLTIAEESCSESSDTQPVIATSEELLSQMPEHVRLQAREVLTNGEPAKQAILDAQSIGIVGEEITILTIYLAGVSRLLPRPISVIVQGSSSSGKSHVVDISAKLFPAETKLVAQQMTPQALFHLPPGSLKNKFVIAGERSRLENDDSAESTRALREMISSGCLSKLMPEKEGGKIVTKSITQQGPISFVESTTLGKIFEEDLNRCLLIHTDETSDQTRRIIDSVASSKRLDVETPVTRQNAIQRLLKKHDVAIHFADELANAFSCDQIEARRMFGMLVNCIRASALLHQHQRQVNRDGQLIADENDYAIAYQVMRKPVAEQLGSGVSDVAANYWDWINSAFGSTSFTVRDLLNRDDNPKKQDRTYTLVKELNTANCLIVTGKEKNANIFKINNSPDSVGDHLPTPEMLFSGYEKKDWFSFFDRKVGSPAELEITRVKIAV